jgi:hypothetical protein
MTVLAQLLIAAALVATAVIYGTGVFAAIVCRSNIELCGLSKGYAAC